MVDTKNRIDDFFGMLFLVRVGPIKPALADVAAIENVVVWSSNGKTMLIMTVYHNQEISAHRVDSITVKIDDDVRTFPQASFHLWIARAIKLL